MTDSDKFLISLWKFMVKFKFLNLKGAAIHSLAPGAKWSGDTRGNTIMQYVSLSEKPSKNKQAVSMHVLEA